MPVAISYKKLVKQKLVQEPPNSTQVLNGSSDQITLADNLVLNKREELVNLKTLSNSNLKLFDFSRIHTRFSQTYNQITSLSSIEPCRIDTVPNNVSYQANLISFFLSDSYYFRSVTNFFTHTSDYTLLLAGKFTDGTYHNETFLSFDGVANYLYPFYLKGNTRKTNSLIVFNSDEIEIPINDQNDFVLIVKMAQTQSLVSVLEIYLNGTLVVRHENKNNDEFNGLGGFFQVGNQNNVQKWSFSSLLTYSLALSSEECIGLSNYIKKRDGLSYVSDEYDDSNTLNTVLFDVSIVQQQKQKTISFTPNNIFDFVSNSAQILNNASSQLKLSNTSPQNDAIEYYTDLFRNEAYLKLKLSTELLFDSSSQPLTYPFTFFVKIKIKQTQAQKNDILSFRNESAASNLKLNLQNNLLSLESDLDESSQMLVSINENILLGFFVSKNHTSLTLNNNFITTIESTSDNIFERLTISKCDCDFYALKCFNKRLIFKEWTI